MIKKLKRLICILLAVCMIAGAVPQETYAMVGALTDASVWPKNPSSMNVGQYNNYAVYWIENDYIRLYLVERLNDKNKDVNTYLVTVPANTKASAKEAYDMVFTKGIYQRPYFMANSKEIQWDSKSVKVSNDNTSITVEYTFKPYTQKVSTNRKYIYTVSTKYYIVGLDEGVTSGTTGAGMVFDDENDEGTYGIRCEMYAGYGDCYVGFSDDLSLSFNTQMVGFNRMGHPTASQGPGLYMSTATGDSSEGFTHTTSGIGADYNHVKANELSWWGFNGSIQNVKGTAITEIFTKAYTWANPFTALTDFYSTYVDGHYIDTDRSVDSLPEYFSATRSGNVILETPLPLMGIERDDIHGSTLWGFRGLRAMDGDNFTPSDTFTPVSDSAKRLGIFNDGNGGYKAIAIESDSAYDLAVNLNGEPVAVIRGNFEEKNDRYVFNSPAALSTSVTAVWSASKGSFSVGKDGSVELSGVNLNAPTFKFYQDKAGTKNGLSIEPSEEGLLANIDSSANSAVIAIDIPGTKVQLEEAVIKMNGDLGFRGNAEFSLLPGAEFNMEELRFGYGKEVQGRREFKVNGIRAEIPEESPVTTEMLGFEMGEFSGTIDTIKSNPEYSFNLMLNVYDLFEASAELMLTKFEKTGDLMPDTLIFDMKSNVGGIKLVAPVVVMEITGGGGGFSGLADTLNGDFFAIPPIKLIASGSGKVMKTIEGTVRYTFGPAYFKSEFSDVEIYKVTKLIDSFYIYEGIQGEKRTYKNTEYSGLSAVGGAGIKICVPHKSKVFQVSGNVDASVYGGLDKYLNPSKVYIVADLNGSVRGSVHIPDGVWLIGGEKIASTSVEFFVGASTVVNVKVSGKDPEDIVEAAAESAFKNFRVYGGVMKEDDWKVASWRAYYIFPENDAGFTVKPFWKDLPEWDWADHIPSGYSVYTAEEDDSLGFTIVSMEPLAASVTESTTALPATEAAESTAAVVAVEAEATAAVNENESTAAANEVESSAGGEAESTAAAANEAESTAAVNEAESEVTVNEAESTAAAANETESTAAVNEAEGTEAASVTESSLTAEELEGEETDGIVVQDGNYSKNVTLLGNEGQTLPEGARVLMLVTPAEGTDMDAFAENLTIVDKNGSPVALTWPVRNDDGEITNESDVNALATTNAKDQACVMIGLGENASVGDSWTVTGSTADFEVSLNASMPFDGLDISLNDYTVSGKVANAAADTDYVLATYFGSEKGKSEYVISYEDIEDPDAISVEIPKEGTMLPTGSYYVTASLLNKVTVEIEDEAGNTTEEEVMLPVDTVEFGSVSYTNTAQPQAPESVAIAPVGNEIMRASWSEVENADGYKVSIYQEQDGSYKDTEMGYTYNAEDIKNGKIKGIAYDADTKTFTLDMALTVGGEDFTTDEEGNMLPSGTSTALEAGKNYKIGVQAYKYLTDEAGEKIENAPVYSTEKQSDGTYLPAYTPVDIGVTLKTLKGTGPSSSYVAKTITEEGGVFSCIAGEGSNHYWCLIPSCTEENVTFTITRMDTGDAYTPDNYTGECFIDNSEIFGSVMFRIDAAVDKGTYTDITTKYLLVQKDDTAPMLSLDDQVVYADPETGEYTVTGLTEPNGKVCLNEEDYYGNPIEAATADENGEFSYTGRLELWDYVPVQDDEGNILVDENGEPIMEAVPNETSALVSLVAVDGEDNCSPVEIVSVTVHQEAETYSVALNANGGTIASGKDVKSYVGGQGALLPNGNDMSRTGYTFAGWYDNKAFTGDPVTLIATSETGNKTYWAKWDAIPYTVDFDSAGGTVVPSKTTAEWDKAVLDGVADPTRSGFRFDGWTCGDETVTKTTTYGELVSDETVMSVTLAARWTDVTAPTGEIKISDNSWKSFFNNISFGVFFKDTQKVTITAADSSGEAVTIEYLLSHKELTLEELVAASFTEYTRAFDIDPENEYVIYAKLIDASGNVSFINTDGVVLDSIVPVSSGIENGKTYCSALMVTVNEKYPVNVTVNGKEVAVNENNQFILLPAEGEQKVVITDKAGNAAKEITVTVNDGHTGVGTTCQEEVVCEVCGERFITGHQLEKVPAKAATVTETGNKEYWHCTECGEYFSDPNGKNKIALTDTIIPKLPPEIIAGMGQKLTVGEAKALSFTSNAAFGDFLRVELDGRTLDGTHYTVREGSTIVTLRADYVAALSAGEHTIGIVSQSGMAATTFTVSANAANNNGSNNSGSIQTGDNSHIGLWLTLLFVSGGLLTAAGVYYRKKKHSVK